MDEMDRAHYSLPFGVKIINALLPQLAGSRFTIAFASKKVDSLMRGIISAMKRTIASFIAALGR